MKNRGMHERASVYLCACARILPVRGMRDAMGYEVRTARCAKCAIRSMRRNVLPGAKCAVCRSARRGILRCGYVRAKRGAEYAAKDYAVKSKFGITSEKWALPISRGHGK